MHQMIKDIKVKNWIGTIRELSDLNRSYSKGKIEAALLANGGNVLLVFKVDRENEVKAIWAIENTLQTTGLSCEREENNLIKSVMLDKKNELGGSGEGAN